MLQLEIDRYVFSRVDTDILAIHGPIADIDISKIFNLVFCLIVKNIMYSMHYHFFKNFKNQDL